MQVYFLASEARRSRQPCSAGTTPSIARSTPSDGQSLNIGSPKARVMKTLPKQTSESGEERLMSSPEASHASLFPMPENGGGREDERYLWPQMLRAIDEIRPTWVVGENVAGITTMVEGGILTPMGCDSTLFGEGDGLHRYELRQSFTIERICRDLEGLGYSVQPVLIPAAAVGAPHRRDRIFILAHVADTDCGDDVRSSGEDEGKGKGKGLSERHSIRKPGEPDQLRSEVQGTNAVPSGGGHPTQEKGGSPNGIGSVLQLQSERKFKTEWVDGLLTIQRDASYSDGNRRDEIHEYLQPKIADGAESIGDGWEHDAAYSTSEMCDGRCTQTGRKRKKDSNNEEYTFQPSIIGSRTERIVTHSNSQRRKESVKSGRGKDSEEDRARLDDRTERLGRNLIPEERWKDFPTVSPVHAGNDGLPFRMDGASIPFAKWRIEALKAYGNAIVPQVMYRIFQAIENNS